MINYLETKINEIQDADFQALVYELCHCIRKDRADFENQRFSFLLQFIVNSDVKCLAEQFLPGPGVTTRKVRDLAHGSVVLNVCRELARLNGTILEGHDGKKVLSLIKACSSFYRQTTRHGRKPQRNQLRHEAETALILQRRSNRAS